MHTTRVSLIQQLTQGQSDAWEEVERIYHPMIRRWLGRYLLQVQDAEDISQEVMTVLVREIPEFQHNGRAGAFRNWLRTTTVNVARNHLRRLNRARGSGSTEVGDMLAQLEDSGSSLTSEFNREHDQCVIRTLLERVTRQFEPITIRIFRMHVVDGVPVRETAAKLDVSIASVHTARSRVLRRLRQDAQDWIDEIYLDH